MVLLSTPFSVSSFFFRWRRKLSGFGSGSKLWGLAMVSTMAPSTVPAVAFRLFRFALALILAIRLGIVLPLLALAIAVVTMPPASVPPLALDGRRRARWQRADTCGWDT